MSLREGRQRVTLVPAQVQAKESKKLTVWLSGSGGTGETPSQYRAISGKSRLRGAA